MPMAFSRDDLVRLNSDLTFEDEFFRAGTLGVIVAPLESLDMYLVILGHDSTTRLIRAERLEPAGVALPAARGGRSARERAGGFASGDRVRLKERRTFEDRVYPPGSAGAVITSFPSLRSSLVDFDLDATDRLLPWDVLEPE